MQDDALSIGELRIAVNARSAPRNLDPYGTIDSRHQHPEAVILFHADLPVSFHMNSNTFRVSAEIAQHNVFAEKSPDRLAYESRVITEQRNR
ncbi:hypothetical protein ABIC16_002476 [Sphingomonas sp. PvP055]|uniref:hypothetical protein n=1 Tax=Sphingomonas sp. PvP055 TaxID=3156391 RepID=UPI003394C2D3